MIASFFLAKNYLKLFLVWERIYKIIPIVRKCSIFMLQAKANNIKTTNSHNIAKYNRSYHDLFECLSQSMLLKYGYVRKKVKINPKTFSIGNHCTSSPKIQKIFIALYIQLIRAYIQSHQANQFFNLLSSCGKFEKIGLMLFWSFLEIFINGLRKLSKILESFEYLLIIFHIKKMI